MKTEILRCAQYILKHPILLEKDDYKIRYLNTLEYFVNKYSSDDLYSVKLLELYKNILLSDPNSYSYKGEDLKTISKGLLSLKYKWFKFYSYKYCLLIDIIFICSYLDAKKSEKIFNEILKIYSKRNWKKLENLFRFIVGSISLFEPLDNIFNLCVCLNANRKFISLQEKRILVTANMSAGKSTLLNALIGKKVNKTQNDSCTEKTHFIFNKAFEDNFTYEFDHELELNANHEILMEDNESNKLNEIFVGTRFRSIKAIDIPICFIDTPGVNSSQDFVHREISEDGIKKLKYEVMLYVLNGENIGTDDDKRHLKFVQDNYKGIIIFVVNKLDRFRKEDSIKDTLEKVRKDLKDIGFSNPIVFPVSAYAAYLAKMQLFGEDLNDDEIDEYEMFCRKLKKEEYQLNNYYPEPYRSIEVPDDMNNQLLLHSGILSLEKLLF